MLKFNIILPDEKNRTYRLVTVLIAILNAAGFIYMKSHVNSPSSDFLTLFGGSILVGQIGNYFFNKKMRKTNSNILLIAIAIASICWMFLGMFGFGFLDLTFAFLGFIAFRKLEMKFFDDKIEFPSFPKKEFSWNELDNLILKDGILTIDFCNNKLMQFTLNQSDNKELNETAFNEFVKKNIGTNK
jgi:hypothetical protein